MEKNLHKLKIDRSKKGSLRRSGTPWLLLIAVFFLGAVLTNFGVSYFVQAPVQAEPTAAEADSPSGQVAPSSRSLSETALDPNEPILQVSGYIVPHHRIEVGSKILGKVAWVGVEKSDQVTRDQLLVKLDDRDVVSQLDQAKATVSTNAARLAELEAGSRPEEIERAQAELERARADLANAELEHERLSGLLESGVISKQMVDDAQTRRDISRAGVAVSEKNLELIRIGPRREQIEQAKSELERSRAQLRYWGTQLGETEIRAPISGTVLERIAEVGEMVSTSFAGGAVVVALADLSDLQVELDISQSQFHKIALENGCVMSPVAYQDRTYRCEIAEIAPEANRSRATIQVKVQILKPDSFLRPEMDAQVTFYAPGAEIEVSVSNQSSDPKRSSP